MIRVYFGALGAGKSYGMTADAYALWRRGRTIYSTCHTSFAQPVDLAKLDTLIYTVHDEPAVCLIDEAGLLLWARNWAKQDESVLRTLVTSRKRNVDLWYTCQFDDQVDRVLRELTTERVYCASVGQYFLRLYVPSVLSAYMVVGRFDHSVFDLYDTYEFVSRPPVDRSFAAVVNRAIDEAQRTAYQRFGSVDQFRQRYLEVDSG